MMAIVDWAEMTRQELERPLGGRHFGAMIDDYLQPFAQHADHPQRLLLHDARGHWFVWTGERPDEAPIKIPTATADWLLTQEALILLDAPHFWIHSSDLPRLSLDALRGGQYPMTDGAGPDR